MGLVYIASVTASASATVSFTTGIDASFNEYQWHFVNMHPAADYAQFQFQVNADGLTGFNEVMTTTIFQAYHRENDADSGLGYDAAYDQGQGTAYQPIATNVGNGSDRASSGILTLYDPSSTTYVKHFTANTNTHHGSAVTQNYFTAGYINTTNAIDEISFKFHNGNTDAGTIHMYGVG
tara:strand:- start:226 stop:762 length:537 start_codon:yes stop_codon:yes gene_type:complete